MKMNLFVMACVVSLTACVQYEEPSMVVTQYNECKRLYELTVTPRDSAIVNRVRMSMVVVKPTYYATTKVTYVANSNCQTLVFGNR